MAMYWRLASVQGAPEESWLRMTEAILEDLARREVVAALKERPPSRSPERVSTEPVADGERRSSSKADLPQ